MIKERPITLSKPMVKAILDGRKNLIRRALIPQPVGGIQFNPCTPHGVLNGEGGTLICKFGKRGDRLWVRETYYYDSDLGEYFYRSTDPNLNVTWKPSIQMPRLASRILLEITNVSIERLRDISEEDAIAEGFKAITKDGKTIKYGVPDADGYPGNDDIGWDWCDWDVNPVIAYKRLYESINGTGSWDMNPWVWVIEFRIISS